MGKRWSLDWNKPTYIYRLFDVDGSLLYVGIGYSDHVRVSQHIADKPWGHHIDRVESRLLPSRREARLAESEAIKNEMPKYNQRGGSYRPPVAGETEKERAARDEVMRQRQFEDCVKVAYLLAGQIERARHEREA